MNDIFMVIAFLVLVGLLVSRITQGQRAEETCGELLEDTYSAKSEQNSILPGVSKLEGA
jgi:hypothetical protein